MSIEMIDYNGLHYAESIWVDTSVDHTTFLSPPNPHFNLVCWPLKPDLLNRHTTINRSERLKIYTMYQC